VTEKTRWPLYQGGVVDLGLENVQLPSGEWISLEIVRHPGGAAVAALNDKDELCLLRQYRHAAGGWIWELPAGKIDEGEQPLVTAQRELIEEAGVEANKWTELGSMLPSPGFCDEELFLYLAQDLTIGSATPEAHEMIEVHWKPFKQALQMASGGEIRDAKTVITLFRVSVYLNP